jgi:hypothetical protein
MRRFSYPRRLPTTNPTTHPFLFISGMSFPSPTDQSIDRRIDGNTLNTFLRVSSPFRFERENWAGKE